MLTLSLKAFSLSHLKTQHGHIHSVPQLLLRAELKPLQRPPRKSALVFKPSVFPALLQSREMLVLATVISVPVFFQRKQNALHSLQATRALRLPRVQSVLQELQTRFARSRFVLSLTVLARTPHISFQESTASPMLKQIMISTQASLKFLKQRLFQTAKEQQLNATAQTMFLKALQL